MSLSRRTFIKGFGAMLLMPSIAVEMVSQPLPPVTPISNISTSIYIMECGKHNINIIYPKETMNDIL